MRGYSMRVSCIPFSFLAGADEKEDPEDPRRKYCNHYGFQVYKILK